MTLFEAEIFNIAVTTFLTALVSALATWVFTRIKRYDKESKAIKGGVKALLRGELIKTHIKYIEQIGHCPIYAKDSATELYNQYKSLGGNGAMDDTYKRLMALPTNKEE